MAISTNIRETMVELFKELVPYEIYNIGHTVLDDGNLETDFVQAALDFAIEHQEEYIRDHDVAREDVEIVIAFLKFLLILPEPPFEDDTLAKAAEITS